MTSKFDLCIATRKPWSRAWPQLVWGSYLLTPGDSSHRMDLSAHHPQFINALTEIHPTLSLFELANLHEKLAPLAMELELSLPDLFTFYKMRYSESLKITMSLLLKTPFSFQKWTDEKNLGAQDLAPLKIWKNLTLTSAENPNPEVLDLFLSRISEWNASRSVGVKLLEIFTDLYFMGKSPDLPASDGAASQAEAFLQELTRLRYPETQKKDSESERLLRQLPWPAHTHAKWMRTGDLETIEVSIKSTSFADLSKKLETLKAVSEKIVQDSLT